MPDSRMVSTFTSDSSTKVAPTEPGSWQQKSWTLSQWDGAPIREHIGSHKLIARGELENSRLTQATMEILRSRGVAV